MTDSAPETLITERRGAVLVLTMNRPKVLNVLDEELALALADATEAAAADPAIRVVVIAGSGRSFMAGGDLACFAADLPAAPTTAGRMIDAFHRALRAIKAMDKPVIAAAQGPVAGGGIGLCFGCDLVVAADDATFLAAYTKLGASPDGGTTWSVTRLLGPRRALEFVLFNESMPAARALELGLVNRVVPRDEVMNEALRMADAIARSSAGATASVKRLIAEAGSAPFPAQLDSERRNFMGNAEAPDFAEGIRAFFDRRPPAFPSAADGTP